MRGGHWQVGGIRVGVTSADPALAVAAPPARHAFACGPGAPHVSVTAAWGNLDTAPVGPLVFDSGGVWTLVGNGADLCFEFRSPALGATPYKQARVRGDFTASDVILHRPYFDPDRPIDPMEYPLDELLIVGRLTAVDGVSLHGCGVADGARGLLFLGQSGAGKSTMARLWQRAGSTILSDDRVIVRRDGTRVLMHGTPWHGDEPFASPGPVELARIFFLRHGADCVSRPIAGAAAVARLFSCSFPPFYSRGALEATVSTLETLARAVPCAELCFPDDHAAIDRVRALA
jgi:hypothetical protein